MGRMLAPLREGRPDATTDGRYATTEDVGIAEKMERSVDRIADFGMADFADLTPWIFASSLANHRIIHERIDEGSLLWRAVKMTGGPILEVGRAGGGSTIVLLGASGSRPVVSVDRAPIHAAIADRIFARPEVSSRLKLYRQSSREAIAESAFGMMFVDGDHSYDGVCHDIATFWNALGSFDGKPPLAAFHDAADNPISFVEPVRRACLQLLAEPGAARVVESWGSMLLLEKTGDINAEHWYAKEDERFWSQYADRDHSILKPNILQASLRKERMPLALGTVNLLGDENVEHPSWEKRGLTVEPVGQFGADNPLRLLREVREAGDHSIAKTIVVDRSQFCFSVFLRPYNVDALCISVADADGELGQIDFVLNEQPRIGKTAAQKGTDVADAGFSYRNGYFCCNVALRRREPVQAARFAVRSLDAGDESRRHPGVRGFFMNLSSVREIL